jgi:hypothetical protein
MKRSKIMPETLCRHIKTNGHRCKSPSLGQTAFCYFHSRLHRRHRNLVENHRNLSESAPNPAQTNLQSTQITPEIELDLPPLEDAESIQIAISLVVAALARNRIDSRRAATILYALQLASTNARSINTEPYGPSVVRTVVHKKSGLDLAAAD